MFSLVQHSTQIVICHLSYCYGTHCGEWAKKYHSSALPTSLIIYLSHISSVVAMAPLFEIKSTARVFDGSLIRFSHMSLETKTTMTCSVFLPHKAIDPNPKKCPTLMYLSGLTCTDENVCQKSGIFKTLSELQVSIHWNMQMYRANDPLCCSESNQMPKWCCAYVLWIDGSGCTRHITKGS